MERVKKIEHEGPNALNNVIDSCEWDEDLKLEKKNFTLIRKFLLPTVKDVKEHTY